MKRLIGGGKMPLVSIHPTARQFEGIERIDGLLPHYIKEAENFHRLTLEQLKQLTNFTADSLHGFSLTK